jgi:hypothetical protein
VDQARAEKRKQKVKLAVTRTSYISFVCMRIT